MKSRVAVLVSNRRGSALDVRAHSLFDRLSDRLDARFAYHDGNPIARTKNFLRALYETRPALVYLMDPIYAAVTATRLYNLNHHTHVILDSGDLVYELAREMGRLSRAGLAVVRWAEQAALKMADAIVVRGPFHRDWLVERGYTSVDVIPDGVDSREFFPMDVAEWRVKIGLGRDQIAAGHVGTMNWNTRRDFCYGLDLIEALALLRDLPVRGLLLGGGDGRSRLESCAQKLGVADKLTFTGQLAYTDLPNYINAMDICLLTQPNSPISSVRTTGKLPLYLACDRYVIATKVGTAARVLPSEMLLPYEGVGRDPEHPARLAAKIRELVQHRERLRLNGRSVAIARQHFDYDLLADRLADVIDRTL